MNLWYVSFCDENEFLGGLHIWARTLQEACESACRIGENPGGQALGGALTPEIAKRVPDRFVNRLLTKAEVAEAGKAVFPDDQHAAELITIDSNWNEVTGTGRIYGGGISETRSLKNERETLDTMEKTPIAEEVMKTIGGFLGDVSDARIKRYADTALTPIRKGEVPLGSLHNEETKRLWLLAQQLNALHKQSHAKADLAETEEEKDAELLCAERYMLYCDLVRNMSWCQIHEDIGGYWDDNIGLREDWVVVRRPSDGNKPGFEGLKQRFEQLLSEKGLMGSIEIIREEED